MSDSSKQDSLQPMVPQYYPTWYAEDEINLVDIWIELVRYYKVFWLVTVCVFVLGLGFTFGVFEERYGLSTAVEIGSIEIDGDLIKLEAVDSVKSKMMGVLAPLISAQFMQANPVLDPFETRVINTKGSEVLLIENKVKESNIPVFTEYQMRLADALIADHGQKIAFYQADLKANLSSARDRLAQLTAPGFLQIKIDAAMLKQKKLLAQIEAIENSYRAMQPVADGESDGPPADPVAQQVLLENRMLLAETQEQYSSLKGLIDNIKLDHQAEVQAQQRKVESFQQKLDTFNNTRVISMPVKSLEPEGLTRKLLLIVIVILAGFAGFAAMLLALFRDKVRQRREELA